MPNQTAIIKVGTRASKLAIAQFEEVKKYINNIFPNLIVEPYKIKTSGDIIQQKPLFDIGGKGLFIKELEEALLEKKIDIAVHSAKDLTPFLHHKTEIFAFTTRREVRDCLLSKNFSSLADLPINATIGTCSPRRKAILLKARPDLKIIQLRGNIDSRIRKVMEGEVDAIILALCGLERSGLTDLIKEIFDINKFLPAGGQGALAIQGLKEDNKLFDIIKNLDNQASRIEITAERSVLQNLNASCITPIAVNAGWNPVSKQLKLQVQIFDYDGSEFYQTSSISDLSFFSNSQFNQQAEIAGFKLAEDLKNNSQKLLQKICNN